MTRVLVFLPVVSLACASKPELDEDFSDLSGADQKSDYFSYRMKILGDISGAASTKYTASPRFRAWTFAASPGDHVDAWVRSAHGDSVAWILDRKFKVLAKNDDASGDTLDSHLVVDLRAGAKGPFYLAFRDYNLESHSFTASLSINDAGACSGSGLIATVPDDCMDDGGGTGIDDALEVYCFDAVPRFCLSGEACPWRDGGGSSDDRATCSRAGLDAGGELFMAHAWCNQWQGHEWYVCGDDGQISFDAPQ